MFWNGKNKSPFINTVTGSIPAIQLGKSLIHEHLLVDFIGADKITTARWNREEVIEKVLPYLLKAKEVGVKSVCDCTPWGMG